MIKRDGRGHSYCAARGHIEHRRSERELRPRVNPGTTPASGSSEKQSRCACRPGECGVGRRPVSPPSRRSQQGSGTRSDSAAAADRPRRGVLVRQVAAIDRERRRSSARVTSLTFRPEVGRDYPLNLSILLSGGKETNEDSLSNGE
ncbi:unnamed protein product [Clavelina lepadiformis]|uniref:Uncharacterized protein n=1 Tax=Clavelina lepadiformis TaxID=159417 RepID=A0ABP0H290_CLALP